MDREKIFEVIAFFKERLLAGGLNPEKVLLFGSCSRGLNSTDSDVDLLVVAQDFSGKDLFARAELLRDAEVTTIRKFLVPLDIVPVSPEEFRSGSSLIVEYAKSGIPV